MNLDDIWKIIVTVVSSIGGIGGIIAGIVAFSTKRLANRIDKKYQLSIDMKLENFKSSLDTQIEKYKSELSKKEYVSKTRFDTEFSLYRELSSAFADMVKAINIMIPSGLAMIPSDREERLKYDRENCNISISAIVKAQDTLNANIPFISEDIYTGYSSILQLSMLQIDEYQERLDIYDLRPQKEKEQFSKEAYMRTREINEKWKALNSSIRKYISTLDIVENI